MITRLKKYFWNNLIAFDQSINTLFAGDPDETISSRMGKWARDGHNNKGLRKYLWKLVNFVVEIFEKDHFKKSIEDDEGNDKVIK